jgi:hypothetical protein
MGSAVMAQALISMHFHFSASLASAPARCLIGRRKPRLKTFFSQPLFERLLCRVGIRRFVESQLPSAPLEIG